MHTLPPGAFYPVQDEIVGGTSNLGRALSLMVEHVQTLGPSTYVWLFILTDGTGTDHWETPLQQLRKAPVRMRLFGTPCGSRANLSDLKPHLHEIIDPIQYNEQRLNALINNLLLE